MTLSSLFFSKTRAFSVHLLLSAAVICIYFLVVYFVWYPQPYFYLDGISQVIIILVAVDVIIGPALTFIVYKPGKPELKMDLSIIAAIQIMALAWGIHITYSERPLFVVFADEFYRVVSAAELEDYDLNEYEATANVDHPALVYLEAPRDVRINKKKYIKSVSMPEYYRKYDDYADSTLLYGIDMIERLKTYPDFVKQVDEFLLEHGGEMNDYAFIPIHGKKKVGMLVLHKHNAQIAGSITGGLAN